MLWFDLGLSRELQVPLNLILERSSSHVARPKVCLPTAGPLFFYGSPLNSIQKRYARHETRHPTEVQLLLILP